MFAFGDPARVTEVLTASGWTAPAFESLNLDLDIAAGQGLEAALEQSTQIGAVNRWLRGQPTHIVAAATESLRQALAAHLDGSSVRLPAGVWLVSSTAD